MQKVRWQLLCASHVLLKKLSVDLVTNTDDLSFDGRGSGQHNTVQQQVTFCPVKKFIQQQPLTGVFLYPAIQVGFHFVIKPLKAQILEDVVPMLQ